MPFLHGILLYAFATTYSRGSDFWVSTGSISRSVTKSPSSADRAWLVAVRWVHGTLKNHDVIKGIATRHKANSDAFD